MGGLRCAKEILDNRSAMRQNVNTTLAALDRQLDCMAASIGLGATEGKAPAYEQQEAFMAATDGLWKTLGGHAEEVAKVAADIQASVEPSG